MISNASINNHEISFDISKQNANNNKTLLSRSEIDKYTENITPLYELVERIEKQCSKDALLRLHKLFVKCKEPLVNSSFINFEILNELLQQENDKKIEYFYTVKLFNNDVSNARGIPCVKQREIVTIKYCDDDNYRISIRHTPLYIM